MHVRVRTFGKPDTIVVVESKLTKIELFRKIVKEKFDVDPNVQRLFYGGKLLEDGYTFHDYNIKLNDVIQLMVKLQPNDSSEKEKAQNSDKILEQSNETNSEKNSYCDAESNFYEIGDLVDMKDREQGSWLEGKEKQFLKTYSDKESDLENEPPNDKQDEESPNSKKKGIAKYFTQTPRAKKPIAKDSTKAGNGLRKTIELLYKIQLDNDEEDSDLYCKQSDIRPRARTVIGMNDLKVGQKVMLNYNTDEPHEKGYWYDFKIDEIKKLRSSYELVGTLYLGADSVPQNETKVKLHDKVFAIEEVVLVDQRSEVQKKMMKMQPDKRSQPLNCLTCRDNEDAPCKDCGCCVCLGKESPETIVLCDECDRGYHMRCLSPALAQLPEGDWYCPECARDPAAVVAPGARQQRRKRAAAGTRDWGRGMACVGKTKTCAMPANHFGPIPGIEVGMCWRFRIQLSESGVHRPPVSGIHGRDVEGAYSIVLSGGYEDDVDNGYEFTYTGSGGRDLSGNKRTAEQSCDQTLTRENKALARNCAAAVSAGGGDAGAAWRQGRPVRVVRSYKMLKHFPKYAPQEGIRYDGIYKVVKYYPEKGLSGFIVWKYLLRRDDPSPAPWEPGAKQFPIVYPDGYLEAEAEKRALKEKNSKNTKANRKRTLQENNQLTESEADATPPSKKHKTSPEKQASSKTKGLKKEKNGTPKKKIPNIFDVKSPKNKKITEEDTESALSPEEKEAVDSDTLNCKLWKECLTVCHSGGKKEFVEHVTQVFLCIICQEVAANPVTTPCLHNFCLACLKLAYKSTETQSCPCCRQSLAKFEPKVNESLRTALRTVMPGYDAGKK
ncbi:unnamed protein product [Parnassius apollo]|uniref:(apollo) hypothetical protein n=1 Tax=Parnassius apollo TaxID=110799 RepID=A0A8S3WVX4_PARAO|nr:unnamed protein product [Parnassius apollo]